MGDDDLVWRKAGAGKGGGGRALPHHVFLNVSHLGTGTGVAGLQTLSRSSKLSAGNHEIVRHVFLIMNQKLSCEGTQTVFNGTGHELFVNQRTSGEVKPFLAW